MAFKTHPLMAWKIFTFLWSSPLVVMILYVVHRYKGQPDTDLSNKQKVHLDKLHTFKVLFRDAPLASFLLMSLGARLYCGIQRQKWPYTAHRAVVHSVSIYQWGRVLHGIAWYCMVLNGIAWYCMILHGIAWYCMVLHCIAWYCIVLHGFAWYCMILHGVAWYRIVLRGIAWYCMALHGTT